jgi:hypothetical protein
MQPARLNPAMFRDAAEKPHAFKCRGLLLDMRRWMASDG